MANWRWERQQLRDAGVVQALGHEQAGLPDTAHGRGR